MLVGAIGVAGLLPGSGWAVVGGDEQDVGETPWLVQVRQDGRQTCTGTLIEPRIVLTAGHCLLGGLPTSVAVQRQRTRGSDGEVVPVGRYALNRAWAKRQARGPVSSRGDLAVLELKRPVDGVEPVSLAGPDARSLVRAGRPAVAGGWGLTAGPAREDRTLRSVRVPVRASSTCRRALPDNGDRPPSVLCAGRPRSRGVCSGDSGGPLYRMVDGRPVQLGVVSAVITTQRRTQRRANCRRVLVGVYVPTFSGSARRWIDRAVKRSRETRPAVSRGAGRRSPSRLARVG